MSTKQFPVASFLVQEDGTDRGQYIGLNLGPGLTLQDQGPILRVDAAGGGGSSALIFDASPANVNVRIPRAANPGTLNNALVGITQLGSQSGSGGCNANYGSIGGGDNNDVSGDYGAIPGGLNNLVSGASALAGGTFCQAVGDSSIALGSTCHALGDQDTAIGFTCTADSTPGSGAVAIGATCSAVGVGAVALGNNCSALAQDSVAIGAGYATAPLAVAIGGGSAVNNAGFAYGPNSFASLYGQEARAQGGTTQRSNIQLEGASVNGAPALLTLSGDGGLGEIGLQDNRAYSLTVHYLGSRTDAPGRSSMTVEYLVHTSAGVAVIDDSTPISTQANGETWTWVPSTPGGLVLRFTFTGTVGQDVTGGAYVEWRELQGV
jgi:hypothetical protein